MTAFVTSGLTASRLLFSNPPAWPERNAQCFGKKTLLSFPRRNARQTSQHRRPNDKALQLRSSLSDDAPVEDGVDPKETTLIMEDGALDIETGNAEILKPDLRLSAAFVFLGGLFVYQSDGWILLGYPLLIFGLIFAAQTARVRFVFGPSKLNVAYKKGDKFQFIRGWAYDQIAHWEIYPSPSFPVLTYFRERESYRGRGSVHFFPVLYDGQQLFKLLQEKIPLQ